MTELEHAVAVSGGQDRAAVFARGVAVIADGAGGTSGGLEAATLVVDRVQRIAESDAKLTSPRLWRDLLLEISLELENVGQSTAVVVGGGHGASVGDSGAWLIKPDSVLELTEGQPRKPLLGGGFAEPLVFDVPLEFGDTLLLATDGLLKYVARPRIVELSRATPLSAEALMNEPQPMQDDVGVVLIRRTRRVHVASLLEALRNGKGMELAVQHWLRSVMQSHSFDGVIIHQIRDSIVAGQAWRLDNQLASPFEIDIRPDGVSMKYGDERFPEGLPHGAKQLTAGLQRPWLFTFP